MLNKNTYSIVINNLHCSYGDKKILKNININFEKNKFHSIIGPNGSGKTTLLKNIQKILPIENNCIYIDGKDLNSFKNKDLAKKIASVPQNTNIDFDFSAMDIVLMGRTPYLKRFEKEKDTDLIIVKEAMEMTNTWYLKDKNINELSGGERQRVIIARALAQESEIILLDEPISNLDMHHQIDILDTIKYLNRDITVIAVLHDLNLAAEYSDSLILLKNGNVLCKGTPKDVLTESNIRDAYNINTHIIKNPITGAPHIIPISKNCIRKKIITHVL
ncbi:ABC transporter ATP-binding protein [Clostridium tetanomorphum]|uniref:ABC transporter ATP-binding protein n=2 Tax=Clostridium tetanomorphum TaxID=1553 RepID=A0A923E762_CLOTT|nr:ABC transporter ATP-binding protein [Clostridium tetanomorphum]MBC2397710.1 ABC transporter ATP-binding protein [Clostridium tetanomorphum]SQC01397.1 ferric enterobactin transport ATP-binding protein fepC [Clostridium tetanomorphum]